MDGEAKTYVIEGGSGKPFHIFFCPTCSTMMWSEPERMEGIACVKAGIFDDGGAIKFKPKVEVFTSRRGDFMPVIEGAVAV